MRFDARTAKLLQPLEHLKVDGCPGLRLEATATTRTWTYRYKSPIDGRMKQTKIGTWPAMSLAAAAGEWEKLRHARDAGADPALDKRRSRQSIDNIVPQTTKYIVRQLCMDYVGGHVERNRKQKGAREVARMFRTMLGTLGDIEAAMVSRAQAFDLLESHSAIPVQAAKLRAELGAAWDYALDAGRLPDSAPNWWRMIMRGRLKSQGKKIAGKRTNTTKRVLSEQETGQLIRWLPNFSRNVADAVTLYLWTGTRGSEIVSIEGREVMEEKDGWWWTVPKAKTKNARHKDATDLRVPLVGRAEAVVRRRAQLYGSGYLFPSTSSIGHIEQKVIQTAVHFHQPYSRTRKDQQRPRLTVTDWAPHDLRRTIRTMLASMGCPDEVAEAVLGHMQPGIRGVYNRHAYDNERREWLTRVSDRLEALASDQ